MRLLSFALLALLIGCTSEPQSEARNADVVIDAPPSATVTSVVSALPRKDPPSALAGWTLQTKEGPALGEPCAAAKSDPAATRVPTCGSNGRVSLEVQSMHPLGITQDPPCTLEHFGEEGRFSPNQDLACIDGDYLLINTVCVVCRMPDVGSVAFARMSELTPEQHRYLARMIRVTDEQKVPRSADGWRELLKKR